MKCNQLRKKAYYQNSNIVVVHVSRPVCNYRHRKRCFGNFLNAVSQQPDNSIKCNVALLGFLFRLLPILNYVIKWWKSQALLETRYAAILYGAFLVSKFKTSHQTCYFSIQIFNPVIKTWSSFIQIWYPSIPIFSSSIKLLVTIQIRYLVTEASIVSIQSNISSIQLCSFSIQTCNLSF